MAGVGVDSVPVRSTPLALILAVVVALLAWLWFGGSDEPMFEPDALPAAAAAGAGDASLERGGADATAVDATARREAEQASAGPTDDRVLIVEVREGDQPSAGAEVRWLREGDPRLRDGELNGDLGELATVERGGNAARTGADGLVQIPWTAVTVLVTARRGELWAGGRLHDDGSRRLVLRLGEDESLRVSVARADGRPCPGARVGALVDREGDVSLEFAGLTGRDGALTIPHVQALRGDKQQTAIALLLPLPQPVSAPLPPPGTGALSLTMPPTGSLRLVVQNTDGSPCLAGGTIRIGRRGGGDDPRSVMLHDGELMVQQYGGRLEVAFGNEPMVGSFQTYNLRDMGWGRFRERADHTALSLKKPPGEDTVVVPYLGAAVEVVVTGELATEGAIAEAAPPVLGPDQQATFTVRAETGRAVLRGRVLREGVPFRGALQVRDQRQHGGTVHTLADGTFELHLAPDGGRFAELDLRLLPEDAEGRLLGLQARARATAVLAESARDLGDLELLPPPELATVLVVDERDQPVPDANVRVTGKTIDSRRRERWRNDGSVLVRPLEQGRHVLLGEPGAERRLTAWARGYLGTQTHAELVPGTEHRLVLPREGTLSGRLLLGELAKAAAEDALVVDLFREQDNEHVERKETWELRERTFRYRGLRAGGHRLVVRIESSGEVLAERNGLVVQPGEELAVPPIELGDGLRAMRLHFADAQGQPIEASGNVTFEGKDGQVELGFGGGEVMIPTARSVIDVAVHALGHRPTRVAAIPGDQHVRLEPGPALEVTWPEGAPSLDGLTVDLRVRRVLPEGNLGNQQSVRGLPPWKLTVSEPGAYRLELSVRGKTRVRFSAPEPLQVQEGRVNTVAFPPDPAAIQKARGQQ